MKAKKQKVDTPVSEDKKQRNSKILLSFIYGLAICLFVGSAVLDIYTIQILEDRVEQVTLERDVCQTSKNVDLAMCQYVLGGCFQALRTK